ncbi:hypothetical protein AAES_141872 [Amazona aestiva]|uniref:Uncharacterized protein n=1 Tax=Amazona aestiva TaxID=12930 RepID=A0A0Q3PI51_AMAAE|nr:hypothetical protein AAES_141872 [Amazona aestiva]
MLLKNKILSFNKIIFSVALCVSAANQNSCICAKCNETWGEYSSGKNILLPHTQFKEVCIVCLKESALLGYCVPASVLKMLAKEPDREAACQEELSLDHILSPPLMPSRKSSIPEAFCGPGKSTKFKRQLSEDGRQFRRGSLGGALTGKYLLLRATGQQLWQPAETSNLVRMRYQALGQSAPSLTANLLKCCCGSDDGYNSQNEETQTELNDTAYLQALEWDDAVYPDVCGGN